MIKDKMADALNKQVNEELYSAYLYGAMAACFEDKNLPGFAQWMRMQADEEVAHAKRIVAYMYERGGRVKLTAIAEPPAEWDSPLEAYEAAYKHECHITDCINKLSTLASKEGDHATRVFLEWFVSEQVEEEASVDSFVQKLRLVKDAPGGLFMLDREAGGRTGGGPPAGA